MMKDFSRASQTIGSDPRVTGVRMNYIQGGEGPAIVLLNGNGVTAENWEASSVFARLTIGHHAIAFDRPGFGYTARPRGRVWTIARQAELIAEPIVPVQPRLVITNSRRWIFPRAKSAVSGCWRYMSRRRSR